MTVRRGSTRIADIPVDVVKRLNAGEIETATLAEGLAIDFAALIAAVAPDLSVSATATAHRLLTAGITRRMQAAAAILLAHRQPEAIDDYLSHGADTVRGWAAYMIAALPDLELRQRLDRIRPLADDPHFGVREWAWMALRPHIAAAVPEAIAALTPWAGDPSERIRRFASEITRPRGVWTRHIDSLRRQPELALAILEPLRSDPSRYVRDSVGNWLNDAAKTREDWVRAICQRWREESPTRETAAIVRRALRSIDRDRPA